MSEPIIRLLTERDGGVLILTMDQPARRNALAMPIRFALRRAAEPWRSADIWCHSQPRSG